MTIFCPSVNTTNISLYAAISASPFVNGHLSSLLLRLGNKFAADRPGEETFLDADQLCYSLHGRGELLPQAEELIPIYGSPLCIQRSDLGGIQTQKLDPVLGLNIQFL